MRSTGARKMAAVVHAVVAAAAGMPTSHKMMKSIVAAVTSPLPGLAGMEPLAQAEEEGDPAGEEGDELRGGDGRSGTV